MKVGLHIHVLDEFISKYTTEKMHKWRLAQIVGIVNKDSIKVHFDGWSEANDIVLDLDDHSGWKRIAPLGLLS